MGGVLNMGVGSSKKGEGVQYDGLLHWNPRPQADGEGVGGILGGGPQKWGGSHKLGGVLIVWGGPQKYGEGFKMRGGIRRYGGGGGAHFRQTMRGCQWGGSPKIGGGP